jgi:hypothetical protein
MTEPAPEEAALAAAVAGALLEDRWRQRRGVSRLHTSAPRNGGWRAGGWRA